MNEPRCRRLVQSAIGTFDLRLDRLCVLTEAATGHFALTPLIAALGGARRVLCLAVDSRFGTVNEVSDALLALAGRWGVADRIEVLSDRGHPALADADVVTNLGFVRPLDAALIERLKPTAVIPLMWETWEFRREDLNLEACQSRGIAVLGTDEHHPSLRTMEYVGIVAIKVLLSLDVEVFASRIAVWGEGEFGDRIESRLRSAGADTRRLAHAPAPGRLPQGAIDVLAGCDALIVAEHGDRRLLIGPGGSLEPRDLKRVNPALAVAHICGGVDRAALVEAGFHCAPDIFRPAGYMSLATDHAGPRPLIDLHTAGLKVGECLANARLSGLPAGEAESLVLQTTAFAQGFA